jgi:hypothetical protein
MKGADSALPIWADFMQAALKMHPEWNGDWEMPPNVRKAEIDVRSGALIRELDSVEAMNIRDDGDKASRKPDSESTTTETPVDEQPQFVDMSNVPAEFRRIELFVSGTVPAPKIVETPEPQYDPETGELIETPTPTPKETPLNGTWQDRAEPPGYDSGNSNGGNAQRSGFVTIEICPLTGMRATVNCPEHERKTYRRGTEPKDFCTFHVNPPR